MFVLKARSDVFDSSRDARKNPPVLITLLVTLFIFFWFSVGCNQLIKLFFDWLSATITSLADAGKISSYEYNFYHEMNIYSYSFIYIFIVPLAYLYARFIEGRHRLKESFLMANTAEFFPHLLMGFMFGAALSVVTVFFLKFAGVVELAKQTEHDIVSQLIAVVICAVTSFSQEYFYRGLMLSSFGGASKPLVAVLLSALFYAGCNYFIYFITYTFNVWILLGSFIFGLLLALVTLRFKSLYVAVGLRFGFMLLTQFVFGIGVSGYAYYYSLVATTRQVSNLASNAGEVVAIESGLAFMVVAVLAIIILLLIPVKAEGGEPIKAFHHVRQHKKAVSGAADAAEAIPEAAFEEEDVAEASEVLKERIAKSDTAREEPKAPEKPVPAPEAVKASPAPAEAKPAEPVKPTPEIKPGVTVSAVKANPFVTAAKTVKRPAYTPKPVAAPQKSAPVTPAPADEDWDEEEKREHADSNYLPPDQYLKK